jgi:hypothetical protein
MFFDTFAVLLVRALDIEILFVLRTLVITTRVKSLRGSHFLGDFGGFSFLDGF